MATYGEQDVIQALKNVNVYILLVSDSIRRWYVRLKCRSCGYTEQQIVDMDEWEQFEERLGGMNCLKCGTGQYEVEEKEDLIEVLVRMSEEAEAHMEVVSTHTEEGEMLYRSFGGIAAITKYRTY